jgi:uncharacterized membrane protein
MKMSLFTNVTRYGALFLLMGLLGLLIWNTAVVYAKEEPAPPLPIVHAVMFWMDTCPHCHTVIDNVLPPLQAKYGNQLHIQFIEVNSQEQFNQLQAIAQEAGVPSQQVGVPFLLIGEQVLIGAGQIPTELPSLIEQYLAAGGVAYPTYPSLLPLLDEIPLASESASESESSPTESASGMVNDGFALAILLLGGMFLAMGYTAVRLYRARAHHSPKARNLSSPPAWLRSALPLLAVIGLGLAAYLAYVETQAVTAVCGPIGDCNAVQTSPYAYLWGIPIGLLGVAGYLLILAVWAWGMWQNEPRASFVLLGLTLFGVAFSIYLTYLELFVIGAVCAWCLSSAVVMTLLLLVSVETAVYQLPHHQQPKSLSKLPSNQL